MAEEKIIIETEIEINQFKSNYINILRRIKFFEERMKEQEDKKKELEQIAKKHDIKLFKTKEELNK